MFLTISKKVLGIFIGLSLLGSGFVAKSFFTPPPVVVPTAVESIFSSRYPVHERFTQELTQMKSNQKLTAPNETLINSSVSSVSRILDQPPSLLWCLLFQESRLDHLSGIDEPYGSTGLGQFSTSAFFEINQELYRYLDSPQMTFHHLLGRDVRPIVPDRRNLSSLHSYYHIPTAVAASGLFLHNRWIQLKRIASQHHLPFSHELLWAWAALSYNKGGRTVLAVWKQIEKKNGRAELERALLDRDAFIAYTSDLSLLTAATSRIWPRDRSQNFAEELHVHSRNLYDCAFSQASSEGKQ